VIDSRYDEFCSTAISDEPTTFIILRKSLTSLHYNKCSKYAKTSMGSVYAIIWSPYAQYSAGMHSISEPSAAATLYERRHFEYLQQHRLVQCHERWISCKCL